MARCISDILERDYRVLTAFSGEEGLSILRKKKVSLVVLDYLLPDMDGVDILKTIKTEYKIPVIMITGHGVKEVVVECLRQKADYYFDKPFSLRDLRKKVGELLKEDYPYNIIGLDPSGLSPDIRRALEFIGKKLSDQKGDFKKLSLEDIAAATSVSPKYLCFLIKKECGMSINKCMNILRIQKAKELLKDKDVKDIAYKLGFEHSNSFTMFFKKMTGYSPSEFKKRLL